MTAISDRAMVSLALECASRLRAPGSPNSFGGIDQLMQDADKLLTWIDSRCAERAKRDTLRANAQKITLPNIT
jgi:hypothetical protein